MKNFSNETEFIKEVIKRADHSPNVIIGLGVSCKRSLDGYPMYSTGSYISGYFYKNGRFYDHFTIRGSNKDCKFGDLESAERFIKKIRKITKIFYY